LWLTSPLPLSPGFAQWSCPQHREELGHAGDHGHDAGREGPSLTNAAIISSNRRDAQEAHRQFAPLPFQRAWFRRCQHRRGPGARQGCVGGISGIGGGSILAPVLIGTGCPPKEVAPAALASTFVTSIAGLIALLILSAHHHGRVAPDWPTGIAQGVGGLADSYTGAGSSATSLTR